LGHAPQMLWARWQHAERVSAWTPARRTTCTV